MLRTAPPPTIWVEPAMGTVFSVDIRDAGSWEPAVAALVHWLHHVDAAFSTYRAGSDISRLRRGELAVADADPLVAEVLDRCVEMQRATDGYFSPRYAGAVDPTGLVKGWAIERASAILREHGSTNHAVGGGGDIQVAGEAAPGRPWRVGISDPFIRDRVLTVVSGTDFAVATSGTTERGPHIVVPFTGQAASGLTSVTVVGRSLTEVDCYATAAFAMGPDEGLGWIERRRGVEGMLVTGLAEVVATTGFGRSAAG
jgi:thiamine biosynthesis lipoprotein